uniref:Uncharacterized protein n=1 Tax=Acrobeloides nanus TaxID=290746 RepID=A0A914CQG0_9BILA
MANFFLKSFLGISIFLFTLIIRETDSLDCYMIPKPTPGVAGGYGMMMGMQGQKITCAPTVSQCFKYVCSGAPANPYYIIKGCLDYSTTTLPSCTTMDNDCRGQGGAGMCYTCTRNRCNGAGSIMVGIATLLLPMVYFFIKN